jgi:hypothetical protein
MDWERVSAVMRREYHAGWNRANAHALSSRLPNLIIRKITDRST